MAIEFNEHTKGSDLARLYASQIAGKVVLVTGPSKGGLGDAFASNIAKSNPALIILAGRSLSKIQPVADAITSEHPGVAVKLVALDLSSFASVRKAAETINSWADVPHIDVFVNNAGIMGTPYSKTEDGFESQFQANHLSHFLLTNLLMDKILAASSPRVICVSSNGHRAHAIRWTDHGFNDGKHYDKWSAYGQSKTANCLMALALAEKLGSKGLVAVSLHPGAIATNLSTHLSPADDMAPLLEDIKQLDIRVGSRLMWDFPPLKTLDEGTATHVYTSFAPEVAQHNGDHFTDAHLADPELEEIHSWAASKIDADRLWRLSEKLVGQEFKY